MGGEVMTEEAKDKVQEDKTVPVATAGESAFELIQRKAKMLSASELVPKIYQGTTTKTLANCIIALETAERIGCSTLMVMQNLHIIQGKPSWSSQFIISALNSCGKFGPLRFKHEGEGDKASCQAYAQDLASKEMLHGPTVSIQMAKEEGWLSKTGSKWKTMPEVMLMYRSASFFGKLYAPEILNGMQTAEEQMDINMSADNAVTFEDAVEEIGEDELETVEGEVEGELFGEEE
jgi:hypothetical protein